MKSATLREVKQQLSEYVNQSQKQPVLVTKHGRPSALLRGVEGYDLEDIVYMTDRSFWKMIRERRSQKAIPWSQMKKKR
ncbi:MAG: type II toxin-antitoxin system Phd/YefM family antitoxin [Deltaproteobacteria bacterium]|nr:type II toxin-antitoxin system Phd/YefM family antitoxin [Deltaproteobacteria bacterium]